MLVTVVSLDTKVHVALVGDWPLDDDAGGHVAGSGCFGRHPRQSEGELTLDMDNSVRDIRG